MTVSRQANICPEIHLSMWSAFEQNECTFQFFTNYKVVQI